MRIEMKHYHDGRLVHDGRYHDWSSFMVMLEKRRERLCAADRIEILITED